MLDQRPSFIPLPLLHRAWPPLITIFLSRSFYDLFTASPERPDPLLRPPTPSSTRRPRTPRSPRRQEFAFLLQPTLRDGSAGSAVLRGPPGTGKTTTVRTIFAEVEKATRKVVPVYVNCRQNHTLLAVYRCIAGRLLGYIPPSRHLDDIREGIAARLREMDAILRVCLDDANYLVAADTYNILLYPLLRLYERWDDIRGAGVFAVTNDLRLNLYAEADGPVRSVFHPHEVTFIFI